MHFRRPQHDVRSRPVEAARARTRRSRINTANALWLLLCLSAVIQSCDGCGPCGNGPDDSDNIQGTSEVPEGPDALTHGFAERLPAGAQALVVARGFAPVAEAFEALEIQMRDLFDLGALESEIRHTFGLDLHRHATFREQGIAYEGGFALATVAQQPVLGFYLVDQAPFLARAQQVLRRQPFNLRAPLIEEVFGDITITAYRRRAGDDNPVQIALVTGRGFGWVVSRATTTVDVMDAARAIAQTTADSSLANHTDFENQVSRFSDYPGFVFLNTSNLADFYLAQAGDGISAARRHTVSEFGEAVTSFGAGARLDSVTRLSFSGYVAVAASVIESSSDIATPSGQAALAALVGDNPFIGVRLGINPQTLWNTIVGFQHESGLDEMYEAYVEPVDEYLSVDSRQVVPALFTGNVLFAVRRLALLSIGRAETFTDYLDALGVVVAAQVADRDGILEVLDGMAAASEGDILREDLPLRDGQQVADVHFSGGGDDDSFGHLFLKDDLLIMVGERGRRSMLEFDPNIENTLPESLSELASELLLSGDQNGAFIRFEPLNLVLTLISAPEVVRNVVEFLNSLSVNFSTDEGGLEAHGVLLLNPPPGTSE